MRNDPSRPHGPAWRQQPGAAKRNPKAQQAWQKDAPPAPAGARVWSRKTKVRVGVATLGGLLAALVGIILWYLPPRPPTLFLFANGYRTNLAIPPNVYGVHLLDQLDQWARRSPDNFWGRELPVPTDRPKALAKGSNWFKDVDQTRFKEKTVVVFFALHGGADQNGPYLLLDDAEPRDGEDGLLRIKAVLDQFKKLPKSRNKVLILDATQVPADWDFGMMHNDFARKLKELNADVQAIDNCIVLSASDVDQRSWTSDVVQAPVFSYYLLQGLQGAGDPNHTNAVNALDLFRYVHDKVAAWARANRAAEQTPVLLPEGSVGEDRAKRIVMTQVPRPYGTAPAPKERSDDWTTDLDSQWKEFARLQSQVPAPAVAHPQLWRYYQALVLRYEELLRAGDTAGAGQLRTTELERVARQLEKNPFDDLACLNNAIPVRAAFGLTLTDAQRRDLEGRLDTLSESPEKQWPELRKWAREKQFPGGEARLRVEACDWLLDKLARNGDQTTRKQAADVLKVIAAEPDSRPAEGHYLFMTLNHLPQDQDARYLQEALRTRRLAEQAALAVTPPEDKADQDSYAYAERVYDWIAKRVTAADQRRRWGEDLLFSSDHERWDEALKHFQAAQETYTEALKDARTVARAFRQRDQALAALPAYSRWLADLRVFGSNRDPISQSLEDLEGLWGKVQRLGERLEGPTHDGIREPVQTEADKAQNRPARSLEQLADEVRQGLDDFKRLRFAPVAGAALAEVVQTNWHEIEALLRVPWIDPDRRKELLAASRRISLDHFSKFLLAQQTGQAEAVDPQEAARHQARMALVTLGARWVDQQAGDADVPYRELRAKIQRRDDQTWHDNFLAYGERIGRLRTKIPEEINLQSESAHKPGVKAGDVADHLSRADQLCRRIDGALVPWLKESPAEESQRLRLARWLTALGNRTVADQWFSEKGKPFYELAADRFHESAETLLKGWDRQASRPLFADLDRLKEAIRNRPELQITGSVPESVTSEKQVSCTFKVGGPGLQPGYPTLALDVTADQPFLTPAGTPRPAQRITQAVATETPIPPPVYQFARNEQVADTARKVVTVNLTARAFYRGQEKKLEKAVPCYPLPDTVVTQNPKPGYGKVAVRTDASAESRFGSQNGVISIVLDCSSSMWDPIEQQMVDVYNRASSKGRDKAKGLAAVRDLHAREMQTGRRRFDKALKGLDQVLQTLDNGFTVNLWAFSASNQRENEITRIWSTESWDRNKDPGQIRAETKKLIPFGLTPLARSLYEVKRGDFNTRKPGFKTIVVLTDGMDTLFKKDALSRGGTVSIPDFLRGQFEGSGIQVFMVLYDVPAGEIAGAKRQFRVVEEWNPPGKLYENTKDEATLVGNLREALHPRLRYRLYGRDNKLVDPQGYPVTPAKRENPEWSGPLDGTYKADVHGLLDQNIQVNKGDFLILTLRAGQSSRLRRALYADEYGQFCGFPLESRKQNQAQAAVLQNCPNDASHALQLKVTLENLESRETPDILRQVWPHFVWWDAAAGGARPRLHWENLEGYPAPLWSLELNDWPADNATKPVLSAWWTYDADLTPRATLRRDPRVPRLEDDFRQAKEANLQRDLYQLQSVTFEDQRINGQDKPCLVVRIRYPKGQPVLALPSLGHLDGARHCFYEDAGQYTGIFWRVSAGDIKDDFTLRIISLNDFKDRARRAGNVLPQWELPVPNRIYQWNPSIGKAPDALNPQ